MGLQTNSRLAEHYRLMRRIRTFEERVGELFVRMICRLDASSFNRRGGGGCRRWLKHA